MTYLQSPEERSQVPDALHSALNRFVSSVALAFSGRARTRSPHAEVLGGDRIELSD